MYKHIQYHKYPRCLRCLCVKIHETSIHFKKNIVSIFSAPSSLSATVPCPSRPSRTSRGASRLKERLAGGRKANVQKMMDSSFAVARFLALQTMRTEVGEMEQVGAGTENLPAGRRSISACSFASPVASPSAPPAAAGSKPAAFASAALCRLDAPTTAICFDRPISLFIKTFEYHVLADLGKGSKCDREREGAADIMQVIPSFQQPRVANPRLWSTWEFHENSTSFYHSKTPQMIFPYILPLKPYSNHILKAGSAA